MLASLFHLIKAGTPMRPIHAAIPYSIIFRSILVASTMIGFQLKIESTASSVNVAKAPCGELTMSSPLSEATVFAPSRSISTGREAGRSRLSRSCRPGNRGRLGSTLLAITTDCQRLSLQYPGHKARNHRRVF